MLTIGRSPFLVLVLGGLLLRAAAPPQTTLSAIAELASDLSQDDAVSAIAMFDPQTKGYGEIRADIEALTSQTDVACAIDVVSDEEAGGVHRLDLDWLITLKSLTPPVQIERRRERVRVEMRLVKGKWRITAFAPLTVLEPIHVR